MNFMNDNAKWIITSISGVFFVGLMTLSGYTIQNYNQLANADTKITDDLRKADQKIIDDVTKKIERVEDQIKEVDKKVETIDDKLDDIRKDQAQIVIEANKTAVEILKELNVIKSKLKQ